jgi:hypothetical protein
MNRRQLESRLSTVTSKIFRDKGYVAFVDIFVELGYLAPADIEN